MKKMKSNALKRVLKEKFPKLKFEDAVAKAISENLVIRMRNKKNYAVMDNLEKL